MFDTAPPLPGVDPVKSASLHCSATITNEVTEERHSTLDEAGDAARRTHLANERTYLAWWRSGLTAFAVALAAGKLVPELTNSTRWPYAALGAGYAVLGIFFVVVGIKREREVADAVRRGEYAPLDPRLALVIAVAGVVLGAATFLLVVLSPG
jgi:putative membrane protein